MVRNGGLLTKASANLPPTSRNHLGREPSRTLQITTALANILSTTLKRDLPASPENQDQPVKLEFLTHRHCVCVRACVLSYFSHVRLFATLWTIAHQAPLPMGFSRQEYWNGLPCPPPGDLPNLGIQPMALTFLPWQVGSLPLAPPGKPP